MSQKISQEGIDLIKQFEGLALQAFCDEAGAWTIGYSHQDGVVEGSSLTGEEAELLLLEELHNVETRVSELLKVPVNANEFAALVSLGYNIGTDALAHSATLKRLNRDDRLGAADGFDWWVFVEEDGKPQPSPGLKQRRAQEKALFLTPAANEAVLPGIRSSTRLRPLSESSPRRTSFWQSRSVKAGLIALYFAGIQVLHQVVLQLDPAAVQNNLLRMAATYVHERDPKIFEISSAIVLLVVLYLLYVRFDDWRKYRR
jgi:lysozyme